LKVFDNRMQRKVLGRKRNGVTGYYITRRFCSVLLTEYYSDDQIKKNEMGGTCITYGDRRGAYRVLVWILEGKRSL